MKNPNQFLAVLSLTLLCFAWPPLSALHWPRQFLKMPPLSLLTALTRDIPSPDGFPPAKVAMHLQSYPKAVKTAYL